MCPSVRVRYHVLSSYHYHVSACTVVGDLILLISIALHMTCLDLTWPLWSHLTWLHLYCCNVHSSAYGSPTYTSSLYRSSRLQGYWWCTPLYQVRGWWNSYQVDSVHLSSDFRFHSYTPSFFSLSLSLSLFLSLSLSFPLTHSFIHTLSLPHFLFSFLRLPNGNLEAGVHIAGILCSSFSLLIYSSPVPFILFSTPCWYLSSPSLF